MPICKKCNSDENIKSGKINGKQRHQCKESDYYFLQKFLILIYPLYMLETRDGRR